MALVLDEMRRTYAAQRGVSQGAALTLAAHIGGYQARFECAKRCAEILGDRHLEQHGDGIALYHIPLEELHRSITKLALTYSVALVDTVTDEQGSRFVLVWRINPPSRAAATAQPESLDDY